MDPATRPAVPRLSRHWLSRPQPDQPLCNPNGRVSVPGVDDPLRCPTTGSSIDCVTQFTTTIGGNPTLKPETSKNYTLGAIWEPTNQLSFGIDAWWIDIEDTILITGISVPTILADLGRFGSLVTRGPADPAFPGLPGPITNIQQTAINQGDTSVSGIDFNASWRSPKTDYGLFNVSLNATYYTKYDITLPDGTVVEAAGTLAVDTPTAGPIPKWKTYLTLNWQYGPWAATLANRYQKGYRDTDGNAAAVVPGDPLYEPHMVSSYTTWDLQGSWSGYQGLTAILGVRNLFTRSRPTRTRLRRPGSSRPATTFRTSTCMISSCTHGLCTTSNRSVQSRSTVRLRGRSVERSRSERSIHLRASRIQILVRRCCLTEPALIGGFLFATPALHNGQRGGKSPRAQIRHSGELSVLTRSTFGGFPIALADHSAADSHLGNGCSHSV